MTRYISINNVLVVEEEATISVKDRGFRFGDGIFETIPIIDHVPYLWQLHLERLQRGLKDTHIVVDSSALLPQLMLLIEKNNVEQGVARIIITRGVGSQGYLPTGSSPTIVIEAEHADVLLGGEELPDAISAWESKWHRFSPTSLPTRAKIMQGMNATLARLEAHQHEAHEALLLSHDGDICELSSGNIFWLWKDMLCTPSLSTGALAGTMRERLISLWDDDVLEVTITPDNLKQCQAVIMTNALRGAVPIIGIANRNLHFSESDMLANRCNHLIRKDIVTHCEQFAPTDF